MTTQTETLTLALETFDDRTSLMKWQIARDAVREALAQPEQELDYKAIGQQAYESGYSTGYMDCAVKMKAQPEQEPVSEIMREMLDVQGQHGNWNYDSYMHGLYNGMEYMVALAEKREPKFRDAPEVWLAKYEVKRNNFNNTESLTKVTTPPQRKPLTLDWEPIQEFWRNNSNIDWDELESAITAAAHGIKE